MNKATKTDFLIERIKQNENNQNVDIFKWAFDEIGSSNKGLEILDLCCGTGKQTGYLLNQFPNAAISCLDISPDAIAAIKKNNAEHKSRMTFYTMAIDDFFLKNTTKFDLIFVSYGLYYASDISFVLNAVYKALNNNGRFLVMGPYGDNNKQLFDALKKVGVKIAKPVIHASCKFMYETVLKFNTRHFNAIHIHMVKNSVAWTDTKSVISYWANSTFYNKAKKAKFEVLLAKHFKEHDAFINDKHIMLIESIK